MTDELTELLDTAIYKEIASQAFYIGWQSRTQDPGAKTLMKKLAREETKHAEWLKKLKEKGMGKGIWHREHIANLRISEYLTGVEETLESASLQETLVSAMKREQKAVEFYSKMISALRDESAKNLCQRLVSAELKHKLKLETLYDELFYRED